MEVNYDHFGRCVNLLVVRSWGLDLLVGRSHNWPVAFPLLHCEYAYRSFGVLHGQVNLTVIGFLRLSKNLILVGDLYLGGAYLPEASTLLVLLGSRFCIVYCLVGLNFQCWLLLGVKLFHRFD